MRPVLGLVAGLPVSDSQPIYSEWSSGGTTTGFVSVFPYGVASTSAYRTTNPTVMSGVGATCNSVAVAFRAKFYW